MFTFIKKKRELKKYQEEPNPYAKCKFGGQLFQSMIISDVTVCRERYLHNMHYTAYTFLIADLEYNLTQYQQHRNLPTRRTLADIDGSIVKVNPWLLWNNNMVLNLWEARANCYLLFNQLVILLSNEHGDYINRRLSHICVSINSMTDVLIEITYEKTTRK